MAGEVRNYAGALSAGALSLSPMDPVTIME
jgi:hypothetical protein